MKVTVMFVDTHSYTARQRDTLTTIPAFDMAAGKYSHSNSSYDLKEIIIHACPVVGGL